MENLAFAAIVASSALFAQDTDPARAYKVGSGVRPPTIVKKVEPHYSKEARMMGLNGTVLLAVTVGTDGKPRDFKVLRSVGFGLDENAIAAVRGWKFGPGRKDGQPVNVQAQIEVNFRFLEGNSNMKWHVQKAEFHLPDGASRPTLEKVAAPRGSDYAAAPDVRLTFDIDEKGIPVNIPFAQASNESFPGEVATALSKWRFKPASKDGHPISVSCTMDFVRGN